LATAQRFVDEGATVLITTGAAVPVDGGYNQI
jgi:hypothetical protein